MPNKPEQSPKKEIENANEPVEKAIEAESDLPPVSPERILPQGVSPQPIVRDMEKSYLEYAMSVIVDRALPDVRDGMKPVHRRILYAMHKLGLRSTAKFLKSARVVGDVLGKYHPHGDTAVYDTMVRMAQDFSLRYPLVWGQGNFGSVDGDSAAAMRYTEAKMAKIADELLADIEKETVDFRDNYDASRKEPSVLPARLPALLLNGVSGIAVGMATNIPPHNLSELCGAISHLIDEPDCSVDDLLKFVKGPDFPTGGIIYNFKEIKQAYYTGKGKVVMRGKASIEESKNGKHSIVITEIPYMVNKTKLVEKIAELVTTKKVQGITDLRDESNRKGMRILIELKKDAYPQKILNQLFKLTQLQDSFHVNMMALVDGGLQPRLLNLKSVLEHFITHRQEVVTRRIKYDLKIAEARAHILEGLKKALDHIDAIIKLIKSSKTKEEAHANLMKKYKFSERQATAILEMKLQTLAGLERQKIEDELAELLTLITELKSILKSKKKIMAIIKDDLEELVKKYGDERRTKVHKGAVGEFSDEDLIPNEPAIVMLTRENYVKRVLPSVYRAQVRGGKGVIGMTTKDEDEVEKMVITQTHDDILFFTNTGKVFRLKVHEIPAASRQAKGTPIVNLLQISGEEKVTAVKTISKGIDAKYVFMATTGGTVKKTPLKDFENIRRSGLIIIKLKKAEALKWVQLTSGDDEVMMITLQGQSIHYRESDVRPMGRTAAGVRGIMVHDDDEVVEMGIVKKGEKAEVLVISEQGIGKRTKISDYKLQNRGGSGVLTMNITAKTGKLIEAAILTRDTGDLIMISKKGTVIRSKVAKISLLGRVTQGVKLMKLKASDRVSSMTVFDEEDLEKEIQKQEESADGK